MNDYTLGVIGDALTVRASVYKMSEGSTGLVPMGYQVHLDQFSGDHVGVYIDATGGKMVRTGTSYRAPISAGLIRNLESAKARGIDCIFGLSESLIPTLPIADVPFWENYLRTTIATIKARFPWINKWEWKNEPGFDGATTARALLDSYPIIKAADPDGIVHAPSQHLLGFTIGRKKWLPEFISAGGLRGLDVFTWHVYGSYGPPEMAYNRDMRWVIYQVLKAAPGMKFFISEYGWQDNKSEVVAGPGHEYAAPEDRGNYIARAIFIHRTLPNLIGSVMYMANDSGGNGFGLFDAARQPKPAQRYAKQALEHVHSWTQCTGYSRGISIGPLDDVMAFAAPAESSPWFVRGTLADGSQELTFWHPTMTTRDSVAVEASADCTLWIQSIGATLAPIEVAMTKGRRYIDVTLGAQPRVLQTKTPGVKLTFPEYSS